MPVLLGLNTLETRVRNALMHSIAPPYRYRERPAAQTSLSLFRARSCARGRHRHHAGHGGPRANAGEQPDADIRLSQYARHLAKCHRVSPRQHPTAYPDLLVLPLRPKGTGSPSAGEQQLSSRPLVHRYDPYAGEADKAKAENGAGDGQSAYDSMKDLFALARQQGRLAADDTRGGWKGSGRLKGGWVGGKDLAEVASGSSVATLMAVAADDMPSSTSSWSDSEEVAQYRAPIATKKQSADFFAPRNGSVDSGKDGEKSKKRKHEKSKKDKKHKSKSAVPRSCPHLLCLKGAEHTSIRVIRAHLHTSTYLLSPNLQSTRKKSPRRRRKRRSIGETGGAVGTAVRRMDRNHHEVLFLAGVGMCKKKLLVFSPRAWLRASNL
mgnify:CR=1 FL=1